MLRRAAIVIAVLALAVGGATAGAATKSKAKNHSVSATVQSAAVSSTGSPPVTGTSVDAGTATGSLGSGAVVQHTTYATPSVGHIASTGTGFWVSGTVKFSLTGSGTLDAQGNATFSGTGKFTGGTGRFKGA